MFFSIFFTFQGSRFCVGSSRIKIRGFNAIALKKQTLWDYTGGSGIINPRGEYIAGPVYEKEDILYADIDLDMNLRAKAVIDAAGHFSRPDILELKIKEDDSSPNSVLIDAVEKIAQRQSELEKKIESLLEKLSN